ncbi:MAG: glutamine-hydrolyzing carbamoyl-phosphate synthase small subunit [Solirubrobacteraceae bacterium]|nr:MAG: carbamoyl-phosphate synthase small subunit [Solirubrobacterales bacterium]
MKQEQTSAYVLLEDGARLDGVAAGADAHAVGEIVFTTAMSGYQEAVTDPSYAGQLLCFTAVHVGNYGVNASAMESDRVHVRAAIMRAAVNHDDAPSAQGGWLDWLSDCGVPAISGVDTRALVRHIRERGSMRGGVFPVAIGESDAYALIEAEPAMDGQGLAREVSPRETIVLEPTGRRDVLSAPRVVALDTGIKRSIVANLRARGAHVELHPCATPASALLEREPDALFLANGPGDPAALEEVVATVRELIGRIPVFGICLGHQLLCRAVGLETYKLPFGHHGANHPVKDLTTGHIEITSQNHGFAVRGPDGAERLESDDPVRWETDFGVAELSHLNMYDRTVEGLVLRDVAGATVQYHPEAGPGPHDSLYLFDRFIEQIEGQRA